LIREESLVAEEDAVALVLFLIVHPGVAREEDLCFVAGGVVRECEGEGLEEELVHVLVPHDESSWRSEILGY